MPLRRHGVKLRNPQMWERAHVGFGGTGRKRKGPCTKQCVWRKHGSSDTRLAEVCPLKLRNTVKYRVEEMRPKWPFWFRGSVGGLGDCKLWRCESAKRTMTLPAQQSSSQGSLQYLEAGGHFTVGSASATPALKTAWRVRACFSNWHASVVKLFFSCSPPPGKSISSRSSFVFESISSRFWAATRKRLEIGSKMTEKRLEVDSLRGGSVLLGDDPRGWAVAEKQFHYASESIHTGALVASQPEKNPLDNDTDPIRKFSIDPWSYTEPQKLDRKFSLDCLLSAEFFQRESRYGNSVSTPHSLSFLILWNCGRAKGPETPK